MKNKTSKLLLLLFSLLFILQCSSKKQNFISGEWKYKIVLNGNHAGKALVKIYTSENKIYHLLEMETITGEIKNTVTRKLVETSDFKPVSIEIINKIIISNDVQEIKISAYAKDNGVDVTSDNVKNFVKIEQPFIFDGSYLISELIKNGFKKGLLIKSKIYDPQIETESSLIMNSAVSDKKKVKYNGKEIELFHVLQYVDNLKTIELLMDSHGTIFKSKTTMLNYTMEMILE